MFIQALCASLLTFGASTAPKGEFFKGFMPIREDREVFVNWHKASPGQPTVVLLNGLTYSTKQWDKFTQGLIDQGFGVLRYDMYGMGKTLLKYAPVFRPIPLADQVQDLKDLLDAVQLEGPLDFVGLSYGGGAAMAFGAAHPERVRNLIVMAPYTQPLEEQDEWIRSQIWYNRLIFPLNPATDDELYDYYLKRIIMTTYPSAEPVVLENPFKLEGVFRMVQGIRKWTAAEALPNLPKSSLHLMVAGRDQYLKRELMERFWDEVPADKRASMIVVNNSEHKIPEAVPFFAARWVGEILRKNPVIRNGRQFDGDPYGGQVRYEDGQLKFPREKDVNSVSPGGE